MTLKKVSEREREKLNECQRYLNETNGIYFQARKEDVQITHTNKKKTMNRTMKWMQWKIDNFDWIIV